MPQKSAIWVKVRAVLSISQTAVAFGISGNVMVNLVAAACPGWDGAEIIRIWTAPFQRVKIARHSGPEGLP